MQAWYPHVTVVTLVARDGRFLTVLEHTPQGPKLNQPAGHLEPDETLLAAAERETLEETGWQVELTGYVGVSLYRAPANGVTYVRHTFAARPIAQLPGAELAPEIIEPLWLTPADLLARRGQWRSPLVYDVIEQYLRLGAQSLELASLHR